MRTLLQIMIPSVICGIITFVVVESRAYEHDDSGIPGFLWGIVLGVLVACIVAVGMLLIKVELL